MVQDGPGVAGVAAAADRSAAADVAFPAQVAGRWPHLRPLSAHTGLLDEVVADGEALGALRVRDGVSALSCDAAASPVCVRVSAHCPASGKDPATGSAAPSTGVRLAAAATVHGAVVPATACRIRALR